MIREIVQIDEALCDGCGECVPNCHEGALQIIDGKARLISELMCDGLGACLGHCPQGAITIEKREAEAYDETAVIAKMVKSGKATVFAHLKHLQDHGEQEFLKEALDYLKSNRDELPFSIREVHELLHSPQEPSSAQSRPSGGCPGSAPAAFKAAGMSAAGFQMAPANEPAPSALTHWPVQLHLINPAASYFQEADLLIAADCAAFAHGDFHQKFIRGKKMVIACPKLDQGKEVYIQKFVRLIDEARINTIQIVMMEVPCCGGLLSLVKTAMSFATRNVPVKVTVISIRGEVLSDEWA